LEIKNVSIVLWPDFNMETGKRILQGARELFFKYGIKSVTMDDIAKHLAMSKKTIYQFFRDKDEIVTQLTEDSFRERQKEFDEIFSSSKDAIHEILQAMQQVGSVFTQMNPNLFYDMQKYHPAAWKKFREFKEQCVMKMVERNLESGKIQGFYRTDIDSRIMAKFRIEQVEMAMNPDTFPPDKFNLTQVQVALLDHFLHGIATLKGHKLINKYKQIIEEE